MNINKKRQHYQIDRETHKVNDTKFYHESIRMASEKYRGYGKNSLND